MVFVQRLRMILGVPNEAASSEVEHQTQFRIPFRRLGLKALNCTQLESNFLKVQIPGCASKMGVHTAVKHPDAEFVPFQPNGIPFEGRGWGKLGLEGNGSHVRFYELRGDKVSGYGDHLKST